MKVKYADRIYNVVTTSNYGGMTWYGIEDEPGHIDWVHEVEIIEEDEFSIPMQAHKLERDKDGFLVGDVSDFSDYLPFLIHDAEDDTLEEVDADNLIDWSSDIDTKPKYDKIYSKK